MSARNKTALNFSWSDLDERCWSWRGCNIYFYFLLEWSLCFSWESISSIQIPVGSLIARQSIANVSWKDMRMLWIVNRIFIHNGISLKSYLRPIQNHFCQILLLGKWLKTNCQRPVILTRNQGAWLWIPRLVSMHSDLIGDLHIAYSNLNSWFFCDQDFLSWD